MAKASTLVSALYQTWDIDHYKAIITPLHHTKDRLKRGERIVCYFWPRAAYGGQQARLTCVGSSNYSNICQQLELQPENYSPAFLTLLSQQRKPVGGRSEPGIATSTTSTSRDEHSLSALAHVGHASRGPCILPHLRANRYHDHHIRSIPPMLQSPTPMTPILRHESTPVPQVPKSVDILVSNQEDTPPVATIPSIGPSPGNILFSTPTDSTVTTVTT